MALFPSPVALASSRRLRGLGGLNCQRLNTAVRPYTVKSMRESPAATKLSASRSSFVRMMSCQP